MLTTSLAGVDMARTWHTLEKMGLRGSDDVFFIVQSGSREHRMVVMEEIALYFLSVILVRRHGDASESHLTWSARRTSRPIIMTMYVYTMQSLAAKCPPSQIYMRIFQAKSERGFAGFAVFDHGLSTTLVFLPGALYSVPKRSTFFAHKKNLCPRLGFG